MQVATTAIMIRPWQPLEGQRPAAISTRQAVQVLRCQSETMVVQVATARMAVLVVLVELSLEPRQWQAQRRGAVVVVVRSLQSLVQSVRQGE